MVKLLCMALLMLCVHPRITTIPRLNNSNRKTCFHPRKEKNNLINPPGFCITIQAAHSIYYSILVLSEVVTIETRMRHVAGLSIIYGVCDVKVTTVFSSECPPRLLLLRAVRGSA